LLSPPPPSRSSVSREIKLLVTDRPGATQSELQFACLLPDVKDGAAATRHAVGARLIYDQLWRILREEMGATYSPQVDAVALRGGTAYLDVKSVVETDKLAPVLGALKGMLASFKGGAISPDDLAWAKMKHAGAAAAARMTNQGIVRSHLMRARMGYPVAGPSLAENLAGASADDVGAEFQACLSGNPTLSLVGDEKSIRPAVQAGWR
jgi:zinc protease